MEDDLKQVIRAIMKDYAPEYFILPKGRYEVGCSNCPHNKRCYDAFKSNASGCNLYDHREEQN